MIQAVVDVEAPREHVFAVLTDFAAYPEWMPGCVAVKVLSRQGETVETEFSIKSVKKMTMGLHFELQPPAVVSFRMVKGDDMKAYEGSWRLMDSADGNTTVVRGEMEMDAGAMVPKFMMSRMAQKSIDESIQAIRKRSLALPVKPAGGLGPAAPAAAPRKHVAKRILNILKSPRGYRVQVNGETRFLPF